MEHTRAYLFHPLKSDLGDMRRLGVAFFELLVEDVWGVGEIWVRVIQFEVVSLHEYRVGKAN